MKAMILSAGLGSRLLPLTQNKPKPLVKVVRQTLLERNIIHLYEYGVRQMVVNGSKFGEQIDALLNEINLPGLDIFFLDEGANPLGTAGGIFNAQDNGYFLDQCFWVVNSDILSNYHFPKINFDSNTFGHLILVPNPDYNIGGDFGLKSSRITLESKKVFTFSGISFLSPRIFLESKKRHSSLAALFRENIRFNNLSGELFYGHWLDVGTIERLNRAERLIEDTSYE